MFLQPLDEFENRRSPYEDDEQEDDNDTNITDDEENVEAVREFLAIFLNQFVTVEN